MADDKDDGLFEKIAARKAATDAAAEGKTTAEKETADKAEPETQPAAQEEAEEKELEKTVPQLQKYQIKKGLTNVPAAETRLKTLQYKRATGKTGTPLSKTSAKRS
jgi:hypothetical protein